MLLLRCILLASLTLLLSGCEAIGYYSQSVRGHAGLMWSTKPIDEVLKTADDALRKRLQTALSIRRFASHTLSLPDNKSYSTYVALKQDPPIWNVVAAGEFSLKPYQWCYLVIGCASYRGYYHRQAAERYRQKISRQGYDTSLIGASAYSTLGWFADPLTSAMLKYDDAWIADLIFHELAHQQLYIKDHSRFNEAFATTVGQQGTIRWLEDTAQQALLQKYQTRLAVRDDFLQLINQFKRRLTTVYESDLRANEMRQKKERIFADMTIAYEELKLKKWQGKGWYDRWFAKPINNSRLTAIATYYDLVPEFTALFLRCEKDFARFYQRVHDIGYTKDKRLNTDCN